MNKCKEIPVFRYTWPGKDEAYICIEHAVQLKHIASAMGLYIQLVPLSAEEQLGHIDPEGHSDLHCSQEVK